MTDEQRQHPNDLDRRLWSAADRLRGLNFDVGKAPANARPAVVERLIAVNPNSVPIGSAAGINGRHDQAERLSGAWTSVPPAVARSA